VYVYEMIVYFMGSKFIVIRSSLQSPEVSIAHSAWCLQMVRFPPLRPAAQQAIGPPSVAATMTILTIYVYFRYLKLISFYYLDLTY